MPLPNDYEQSAREALLKTARLAYGGVVMAAQQALDALERGEYKRSQENDAVISGMLEQTAEIRQVLHDL